MAGFIHYFPERHTSETSRLASHRESAGPGHHWRHIQSNQNYSYGLTNRARMADRTTASQQYSTGPSWACLHPFAIYRATNQFTSSFSTRYGVAWRTFRVRAGLLLDDDANGILPDGTDQVGFPYWATFQTKADGTTVTTVNDITAPTNTERFWIWIERDVEAAYIRYGTDPTASSYTDSETNTAIKNASWTSSVPWTSFPDNDPDHICIGYIDTNTKADRKIALVRQYLVTDVMSTGGTSERLEVFKITGTVTANYVEGHTWDGSTEGETAIKILKPYKLRESCANPATIRGVSFTYSDYDWTLQQRVSTGAGVAETQLVTPCYIDNDLIYAMKLKLPVTIGDDTFDYLDINADARAWAKKYE